jgi:DNA-directed RNA polymerase sigma subunit (sigma70/sigma32)
METLEKDAVDKDRKASELSLWKEWRHTSSPVTLGKLLTSFQPVITSTVKKFESVPLPPSTISAEAKKQAVNAFRTFDPKAGAALGTHVYNYMMKVNRFVYEHQNIGRIPEHRVVQIGTFNAVKSELQGKLRREPSAMELSDELGWSLQEVERMEREMKREVPASAIDESDFSFSSTSDAQKVMTFIYYELIPQEKVVFEYLTGYAGKPKLDEHEIAKKLDITHDRVKKVKAKIAEKIKARMP